VKKKKKIKTSPTRMKEKKKDEKRQRAKIKQTNKATDFSVKIFFRDKIFFFSSFFLHIPFAGEEKRGA
jgi:hypothetical protein